MEGHKDLMESHKEVPESHEDVMENLMTVRPQLLSMLTPHPGRAQGTRIHKTHGTKLAMWGCCSTGTS